MDYDMAVGLVDWLAILLGCESVDWKDGGSVVSRVGKLASSEVDELVVLKDDW